ncbi:M48 family metallopeptidase [Microvirga sp. W0021]|uniref:M48 family metallopeptidase n=1 Tax=Hohaiivirga grylli TaxID=3133970 RepID=A0ABV0BH49_9HYPH
MFQVFGIYTYIRANRIRSGILIGGLCIIFYLFISLSIYFTTPFLFFPENASIALSIFAIATVMMGLWIFWKLSSQAEFIAKTSSSHFVERTEEPRFYNLTEELCISCGLAVPNLSVIETDVLNAFASGLEENKMRITVTRGLLNNLNDQELRAVIAHELTHIRNGDSRVMTICFALVGSLAAIGQMFIYRSETRSGNGYSFSVSGRGLPIVGLVAYAAWIVASVLKFSLSRSREYLADAGAVELTKDPQALIGALRKIAQNSNLPDVPSDVMEMCFDNQRRNWFGIFNTHPSVEKRVAAILKFAGQGTLSPLENKVAN